MILSGWKRTAKGWQHRYKVQNRFITLPDWMAKTWQEMAMVPTLNGGVKI